MSAESRGEGARWVIVSCRALLLSLAIGLSACGDDAATPGKPGPAPAARDVQRIAGHPPEAFLLNEDCFFAARDPSLVAADDADFLEPEHAVVGLSSPEGAVAIPLRWLAYHRVVDLPWGDGRILVTYAPLDGRVATYTLPERDHERGFGVAGHLLRDLLLYDGRGRSLWLQKSGACISGWREGETLPKGPAPRWRTFGAMRDEHPDLRVMAPDPALEDRYPSKGRNWQTPLAPPPGLAALPASAPPSASTWINPQAPPTVDDATWQPAEEATYVKPHDDVLGLVLGDQAFAVPIFVLADHHAINATLERHDVLIAVCDLCSTAAVYDARVGEQRLTFDLLGAYQGAALLEDRQTRSRWSVVTGACVFGWFRGTRLRMHPSRWTHWKVWHSEHPETHVLAERPVTKETLALREGGLRGAPGLPAGLAHTVTQADDRLPPHALVLGLSSDDEAPRAYAYDTLRQAKGVANDTRGDTPIVVLYDAGTKTATAHTRTTHGANPRTLTFARDRQSRFFDRETESIWNLSGRAVSGPLQGQQLAALSATTTQSEWYAWIAFHPTTTVWSRDQ